MTSWRSRAIYGMASVVLAVGHGIMMSDVSNTDFGMFTFHGSAVLLELVLIALARWMLSGRVCDDMETLCIVSVAANALGWALYLAYAPPVLFNTFMWGLSYVQAIRLSIPDRYDANHYRLPLFWGGAGSRD